LQRYGQNCIAIQQTHIAIQFDKCDPPLQNQSHGAIFLICDLGLI